MRVFWTRTKDERTGTWTVYQGNSTTGIATADCSGFRTEESADRYIRERGGADKMLTFINGDKNRPIFPR
jgi:hypothetical protein